MFTGLGTILGPVIFIYVLPLLACLAGAVKGLRRTPKKLT